MKPKLVPLFFEPGRDEGFDLQLANLRSLLGGEAELLPPSPLGADLPSEADAVVFPQLLGEGYRRVEDFQKIKVPILIITSEFGTLSMWDWELISYLREHGVKPIAPYSIEQTRKVIAALRVKNELRQSKFLVYQDHPGAGPAGSDF